jgi:hypothetical protein
LVWLRNNIDRISAYFTDDFREPESVRIFFKALVVFALVKMILIWPVCRIILSHHTLSLPASIPGRIFLAPAFLANKYPDMFFVLGISLVLIMLIVRSGMAFRALFFCLTFNLYIIGFPISDGADVVLFMLGFWSIPLVQPRQLKSPIIQLIRTVLFNLALLFAQLQIVFIYAVSGLDKLLSETWRSGKAFAYIEHLEFLYNPVLPGIFGNPFWNVIFSWSTMLFELLFTLLIWNSRMRLPMLLVGTVFHLFIFVVLSLPDFALIMILSYLIFLRDLDYRKIKSWIRPKLL